MNEKEQHTILYDGDCGICNYFAQKMSKLDQKNRFRFIPFQDVSEATLRKNRLSRKKCEQKIYMLKKGGGSLSGVHCINFLLLHFFPYSVLPVIIYAFPPFLLIELGIYSLIARNRHRISRWLGLNACQ